MPRKLLFLSALCALFFLADMAVFADTADARPYRVDQIPSGRDNNCHNCHVSRGGGGPRNVFGTAVEEGFLFEDGDRISVEWNRDLARLDSDGDGYTNGEELGDPSGSWFDGEIFDFAASLPGDATSTLCGDRTVNGPEECDGPDRDDQTCESLGRGRGSLRCNLDCTFDVSGCEDSTVCGDGVLQETEQCDGDRLRGRRCDDFGFTAGETACDDECMLDTSGCYDSVCGDGVVDGFVEECDTTATETCEDLGLEPGTVTCTDECVLDTSLCGAGGAVCGDGVINGTEECDGDELDGINCEDLGFDVGTPGCTDRCLFDDSECRTITCGDGVVDPGEECEGEDLAGLTCADFDLPDGPLVCTAECLVDVSGCVGGQEDTGPPMDTGVDAEPDAVPDTSEDADDANEGSGDAGDGTGGGGGGKGCSTTPTNSPWGIAGLIALLGLRRRRSA